MFDYEAQNRLARGENPDAGLLVSFFYEPKQDQKGEWKETPFIRIWMDKDTEVVRPVEEVDKKRFKTRWQAFLEGEEPPEEGTPINKLAFATPANVAACKAERIFTVEQLLETPDSRLQKAYLLNFKYAAKDWFDAQKDVGHLKEMRAEIESLKQQLAAATERLASVKTEEEPVKKRGRPKRVNNTDDD